MSAPRVRILGHGEFADALRKLCGITGAPLVDADADLHIWAVPVSALRELARSEAPGPGERVLLATRGLEPSTGKRPSQLITEESGCLRVGALAGPLLPVEVAHDRPCAAVAAAAYPEVGMLAAGALRSPLLRLYTSTDLVGAELASALVDVFAVALGTARGLGLGSGAEALLVARAAAEGSRLASRIGGDSRTFSGLAGVGDLVACSATANHPGHVRGLALARGERLPEVAANCAPLLRHAPHLPIVRAVAALASGEARASDALAALMSSSHLGEWDG